MSKTVDITLEEAQTEGTQATVAEWLKKVGDRVHKGEPIIELETDKVMMEITAPADGVLSAILVQVGETATDNKILGTINTQVGSKIANEGNIDSNKSAPKETKTDLPQKNTSAAGPLDHPPSKFKSPAVRRLLSQHNLNPDLISGSGKNNRLTSRDIKAYLNQADSETAHSNDSQFIKHTAMRRKIAEHMQHSVQTAPHVTAVFDVDLSRIMQHRKQHKKAFEQRAIKLTYTAYFIAATIAAIRHQPKINARFHEDGLQVFNHINIGIGTALGDDGLIVPVLKHCENKDLQQIAQGLTELTDKARTGALQQSDVQGGTFTISNHGVSGSLVATPIIINQPQVAILGLGKIEKRPVVKTIDGEDALVIKPMCYVSLTIDHRALDAYHTNDFLNHFKDFIENWEV
ncbi:MAG: 2-oxo acid dehydrogenase subunit E2 [Proteobacteria bacterium]|nr:MAG: 2-oxo acid dehydrogenase subunit E2 [Pseudomonadota bacterium]